MLHSRLMQTGYNGIISVYKQSVQWIWSRVSLEGLLTGWELSRRSQREQFFWLDVTDKTERVKDYVVL